MSNTLSGGLTADKLAAFLLQIDQETRKRLRAEGKSPEEIDAVLQAAWDDIARKLYRAPML